MMTEIGLMIIVLNVVAVAIVYGNRLGWWKNWLMCATGAFSFSILLSLATTLSPFANGFIMAAITALLRWLGSEHSEFVATAAPAGPQHIGHR